MPEMLVSNRIALGASACFKHIDAGDTLCPATQKGFDVMQAKHLIEAINGELGEADQQLRQHAYLKALRSGVVKAKAIKAFPGHRYHIIVSDLRSIALMVHRFADFTARAFFNEVLQAEIAGHERIIVFGSKLGMSRADLEAFEPKPTGFAYAAYMAWQSVYASAAEIAAGFLVNFAAWGHNCAEMSVALREHYGFAPADTAFLDAFADMPSFDRIALTIVQDGLEQGVRPELIRRAALLIQAYELMFWDTMAAEAKL